MNKNDGRKIVIICGGVIGLGFAYHLAKLGGMDVLLIECHRLTSGTSSDIYRVLVGLLCTIVLYSILSN